MDYNELQRFVSKGNIDEYLFCLVELLTSA